MNQRSQPEDAGSRPPLISVVIPAYNAADYIGSALDSVLAQTFSDYEIIVVNDGSPDTPALEQALQPYLRTMRYFQQENRGPSSARNLAIRRARGKYVAFLDSDDLWLPQHLEWQLEMFSNAPALGLVYGNGLQFQGDTILGTAFENVLQAGPASFDNLLAERCTVNTSSAMVLRDALLQAGLFDENMNRCEDFDLWLRLAGSGTGISYDRRLHVRHRLSNGLAANRELMKRARADVYRKVAARTPLAETQRKIVDLKLKELEAEIHVEIAKQALLRGDFSLALSSIEKANSILPRLKLQLAEIGLRYFPRILRWVYFRFPGFVAYYRAKRRGIRNKATVGDGAALAKPMAGNPAQGTAEQVAR